MLVKDYVVTSFHKDGCFHTRIEDPATGYATNIFSRDRLSKKSMDLMLAEFAKRLKKFKKWRDGEWLRFADSLMQ